MTLPPTPPTGARRSTSPAISLNKPTRQPSQARDPSWEQWRADGAEITAKVYFAADETPPNADDVVHRVVGIVQSATTQDNRLIDEIRHTAWVVANKSNDGWRVTSIQF